MHSLHVTVCVPLCNRTDTNKCTGLPLLLQQQAKQLCRIYMIIPIQNYLGNLGVQMGVQRVRLDARNCTSRCVHNTAARARLRHACAARLSMCVHVPSLITCACVAAGMQWLRGRASARLAMLVPLADIRKRMRGAIGCCSHGVRRART